MSLSEFDGRIALIEANYSEFFKDKSIHDYYACSSAAFDDIDVKKDELVIFENTDLPNHIREEIADAFADVFFK